MAGKSGMTLWDNAKDTEGESLVPPVRCPGFQMQLEMCMRLPIFHADVHSFLILAAIAIFVA